MSYNRSNGGNSQRGTNSTRTATRDQQSHDDASQGEYDDDNPTPSPTKSSSSPDKKSPENDSDNRENKAQLDRSTLQVVKKLKVVIEKKGSTNRVPAKAYIEEQVANIREEQCADGFSPQQWKKTLPSGIQNCSESLLRRARAYSDDPQQVAVIIANMKKTDSTDATSEGQDQVENSLDEVIEPIKRLQKGKYRTAPNLSAAVLDMSDNEIDRADRMFYAEARNLIGHSDDYTFENAHDQVQAIRLMQYEIEDEEDLRCLIEQHRNFNDAYLFLQQLMKRRMKESSGATTTSSSRRDDSSTSNREEYNNDDQIKARRKLHRSAISPNDPYSDDTSGLDHRNSPSNSSNWQTESSTGQKPRQNEGLMNSSKPGHNGRK